MRKKRKLKKWVKCFLICYFFVLVLPFLINASAKFVGVAYSNRTTGVAKPIINFEIKENTNKVSPKSSIAIDFIVYNFEHTRVSDIKMNYKIKIEFIDNVTVPLKLELYDTDNNVKLELDENSTTIDSFSLPATEKKISNYQIIVSWNSDDDSYIYQNLEKNINVTLDAEQSALGG